MSDSEQRLFDRLVADPLQRRVELRCDAALQAFARERAMDMATRGYFGHLTPERVGPNLALRDSGYPLPSIYGGSIANSVEAIAAGYADVDRVWRELLNSPSHRSHMLGEVAFFREQDEVGVAHVSVPGSEYRDYWVVVIARKAQDGEPFFICSPEPAVCFQMGTESEARRKARREHLSARRSSHD